MTNDTSVEAMLAQDNTPSFGETLKAAREAAGLSIQDAAARLNLSPHLINRLETEDLFHSNLPRIYLRGYLRSYGRILNLPDTAISAFLEKLDPTPALSATAVIPADALSPSFPLENKFYFPRLGSFFIALVLLSSMTAWWYLHNNSPAPTIIAINELPAANTLKDNAAPLDNNNRFNASNIVASAKNTALPETTSPSLALTPKALLALSPTTGNLLPKKAPLSKESDDTDDTIDEQD